MNQINDVLPDSSSRKSHIKQYLEVGTPFIKVDPKAPLMFGDPESTEEWLAEMTKGHFGGPKCKSSGEIPQAIESIPTTQVELLRFLLTITAGRLHVADQSARVHTWLVWNGRIYEEYNRKFTDTLTSHLADMLDIAYIDVVDRASGLLSDKDEAKKIKPLLDPIDKFINTLRNPGGLKGFSDVLLGNSTLNFDEDEHENDARGYVVESDGRLRHISNLDVIAEPDPTLLITRTLDVCTTDDWVDQGEWSSFLAETFGTPDGHGGFIPDEGKERLLRQAAGVALIGTGQSKHMIHIIGTGNSGKSFYLDALNRVFGKYGHAMSSSGIIKLNGVNFQQDEARGIRFLYISEPDTAAMDGPFVKTLTGGSNEKITTNRKGISSITWSPQCMMHIVSNDPLNFNASDTPLNNRILTVTAENSVLETDERFDPNRVEKIISRDIETVYRWCLQGAKEFLENGGRLDIPGEVRELQKVRADAANSAIMWLNEKIDEGLMARDASLTAFTKMYKWNQADYLDYEYWCATKGYKNPFTDDRLREEINKYMNKPTGKDATSKKAGYHRLWGLVEGPSPRSSSRF